MPRKSLYGAPDEGFSVTADSFNRRVHTALLHQSKDRSYRTSSIDVNRMGTDDQGFDVLKEESSDERKSLITQEDNMGSADELQEYSQFKRVNR